ncbi:SulP family inorganic anion transporter [bacterium]|nr:SulP family inorganic anion transporter [bacterium]MBP9808606.1 SulP family inorganic anion transporter [bacterium]
MKLSLAISSPLISDLRNYKPDWLSKDLIAGLSVAAVQIPTAIAYAQLAGMPPEIGLYASILPVIVFALLSSSRQLVVGPDAATCTMVASLVAPLAAGDSVRYIALSSALSLASGLIMVIGGFAGMGFIVNFFARPILIGFLNGIAASIIVGQMGKLLGISLSKSDFIPCIIELASSIGQTNIMALAIGLGTFLLLVIVNRLAPKAPSALIAIALATVALVMLGGEALGVKLVGAVPAGLPHLGLPTIGYHAGQGLFVSALGLVIVSFTSGMLTARSFAARSHTAIDANREMSALGAANLASGLCGAFVITGADSRTAVNAACNNKTQLASIFAALATAAVAAFFTQPLAYVPLTALAAVLIYSAAKLLDFSSYRELKNIDILEFNLSILTTIGVLALGVLPGVAFAIALAVTIILMRIYKPEDTLLGAIPGSDVFTDLTANPDNQTRPNIIIWRFDGPLVFFNADFFKMRALQVIEEAKTPSRWFILSLESISQMDSTGIKALAELHDELTAKGIKLLLARPKLYMRRLRDGSQLKEHITPDTVFSSIHLAVSFIEDQEKAATSD